MKEGGPGPEQFRDLWFKPSVSRNKMIASGMFSIVLGLVLLPYHTRQVHFLPDKAQLLPIDCSPYGL